MSLRGQFGAGWWDIVGQRFSGTVKPFYVDGNVVYNWEGGILHPFVTGGIGMYRFRSTEDGLAGSDTKVGFKPAAASNTSSPRARRSPARRSITRSTPSRRRVRRSAMDRLADRDGDQGILLSLGPCGQFKTTVNGCSPALTSEMFATNWPSGSTSKPAHRCAPLKPDSGTGRPTFNAPVV